MEILNSIAIVLFGAFIVWRLVVYIRQNPETLSRDNINKSMYSMGLLALVLIAFIGVVVWLLRAG